MIMPRSLLISLLGLPLLLPAAERAALVIGVNRYTAFPADKQLTSPVNDAEDVARRLAAMGFVVQAPVLDGTRQAIMDAKRRFLDDARGAQVALFYFSGHGFQVGDENYLIPSDMPAISSFTVLRENAVQLRDSVMAGLEEAGAGTKVIILDCCRDNPFAGQIAAALGTKSLRTKGGGGEISGYGSGFFLAFASSPGATALDGNGARNSPFTAALIHHLDAEPGANLRDLFDGVKSTVSETHGEEQVPWVNDSLNRQHVKVLAKAGIPGTASGAPAMNEPALRNTPAPAAPAMPQAPVGGKGFTNSLGMKFMPVPGTQVLMCIHETRNADYAVYAAAQSGVDDAWRDLAGGKEQHPVVNVSHEDAEAFCRWLSTKEGNSYRLPTDAEWSAAVGLTAEQGRTPREKDENAQDWFPWGRHWPPRPTDGNYQISGVADGHAGTAPVLSFPPNELGIHDLGGNGLEWCQDWTDESRVFRVQRGGSWRDDARASVRAAARSYGRPADRLDFQSFRIVRVDDDPAPGAPALPMTSDPAPSPAAVADPLSGASQQKPFHNSLGMAFVPAGTPGLLFSVWETRVMDFAAFVEDSGHDAVSENAHGTPAFTLEHGGNGPEWKQAGGSWRDPRFPQKQSGVHPVVCVSYLDAEAFCAWLTKKERAGGKIPAGAVYRLPSDSEWSRACGGSEYPWGDTYPPKGADGNYAGAEAMVGALQGAGSELSKTGFRDGAARTSPAGMFRENRFGLHDMGGNVFEWCSTWYTADLNEEEARTENPVLQDDKGGQVFRVLRGASWGNDLRVSLRSSYRDVDPPMYRIDDGGFRCVLVVSGG